MFKNKPQRMIYCNASEGYWKFKDNNGIVQQMGSYEGFLIDINITEEEYQGAKYEKLSLTVQDGEEKVLLQMKLDSGYGRGFCQCISSADLSKKIEFTPSYKEMDGKKLASLFLRQGATVLKWSWTKDNPGDLPKMIKTKVKGKEVWDNSEQLDYFKKTLLQDIKPKLKPSAAEPEPEPVEEAGDPNDLPF